MPMPNKRLAREIAAILLSLALIALLLTLSYDAAIILSAVAVLVFGLLFRPGSLRLWIPALLISAVWIIASGDMYAGYNVFKLEVSGLALFPMIAWPTGLMAAHHLIAVHVRAKTWLLRWLILSTLYSLAIIAMEWVGYNLLGVHLDRGLAYPGWPVLNIFHCPGWMQAAYFLNGILFMGAVSWLGREPGAGAEDRPGPRG